MYDELVKSLRELCEMTAICDDYSCFECPYEEECGSYKNGRLSAVYRQAADAIEQLSNAGSAYGRGWTLGYDAGREENKPCWIPVTERLPEETDHYLVHIECKCDGELMSKWTQVAWFCKKFYWEHSYGTEFFKETVTHWMPLPEPPEEG
ncbi:MAG: DUF551 domain-containing protein [bacterium]